MAHNLKLTLQTINTKAVEGRQDGRDVLWGVAQEVICNHALSWMLPSSLPCCLEIPLGKASCFLGTVPNAPSCFHVSDKCCVSCEQSICCMLGSQNKVPPLWVASLRTCMCRGFVQGIFGERLRNNALPLGFFHKGGLHIPRLSAHSAFQSCHLKNECIIVNLRDSESGDLVLKVVLWEVNIHGHACNPLGITHLGVLQNVHYPIHALSYPGLLAV